MSFQPGQTLTRLLRARSLSTLFLAALCGCSASAARAEFTPPQGADDPTADESAAAPDIDGSLSFVFENDTFAKSDNNFTTGWSFNWTSVEVSNFGPNNFWPEYVEFWSFLPVVGDEGTRNYVTVNFGQSFATASDIGIANPPQTDQPYAGLLALTAGSHTDTGHSLHSWYLMGGVVGPSSLAEQAQTEVHKIIDSELPQGWDTQLHDEPILNAFYDLKYRVGAAQLSDSSGLDLTTSTGASLGNLYIGGSVSAFGRIGYNLPENYGPSYPRTGLGGSPINIQLVDDAWHVYGFYGADLQWVGHNLFLDGNTWTDSRSVDKEDWVAGTAWGFGVQKGAFLVTLGVYAQSDTYKTQLENNEFGAITIAMFF